MSTELIIVREYCQKLQINPDFIALLSDEGLIEIDMIDNEQYIHASQLKTLEQYIRWHYDLSINVAGIDAIRHLLNRMDKMQQEIIELKSRLRLYNED